MKTYKIKELFGPTIQGEGSFAGMPCLFLRFAGCNRNCDFCDTDWKDGQQMTPREIVAALKAKLPSPDQTLPIILTGGEPTLQIDEELLNYFAMAGFTDLHMESNGSIALSSELRGLLRHVTISPKQTLDMTYLHNPSDVKILYPYQPYIDSLEDWIHQYNALGLKPNFYLQPIWGHELMRNIKEVTKELVRLKLKYPGVNIKLSLQTHKFTGAR